MNNIRNIEKINEEEFKLGIFGGLKKGSWHDEYRNSAWVFIGGLSYELTEGDVICVMSQWGEVEDIHLVREKETNKPKGFAFLKYEDQRSTVLAVDNFNGVKLLGRTLRVDHVDQYKLPKEIKDEEIKKLEESRDGEVDVRIEPGHAYRNKDFENGYSIKRGVDLWKQPGEEDSEDQSEEEERRKRSSSSNKKEDGEERKKSDHNKHHKKEKKEKKDKKKNKHHDKDKEREDNESSKKAKKKEKKRKHSKEHDNSDNSDDEADDRHHKRKPPLSEEEQLRLFQELHRKHVIPYQQTLPEGQFSVLSLTFFLLMLFFRCGSVMERSERS